MVNSITFVCAFNKTRSQIAAFLFNKLNKNKNWVAISMGVFVGKYKRDPNLEVVAKKYNFKTRKSRALNRDVLGKQKMIIIVADDIPVKLFKGFKNFHGIDVDNWEIKDSWKRKGETRAERLEEVYLDIERKMKSFVKRFNR
jgi:protein-tyrosine-phosphatase